MVEMEETVAEEVMRVSYLVVVALTSAGCGGDGSTTTARIEPLAVSGRLTFQSLSADSTHSCGVTTAGAAYCWGWATSPMSGLFAVIVVAITPVHMFVVEHPTLAVLVALASLVSVVGAGWFLLRRWRLRRLRRRESASAGSRPVGSTN